MMLHSLQEAQINRAPDGKELDRGNCTYYAYCILHNHVHILLREGALSLSELMKRIENRFVRLYNDRYERIGHLFQDRFVSEPVDDPEYFYQLIRYIHRNPVKAMEADRPEDYEYSSWREYLFEKWIMGSDPLIQNADEAGLLTPAFRMCDTQSVMRRFGETDVVEWVNMDKDDRCLDMDYLAWKISDATAWQLLKEISDTDSVEEFKQLSKEWQIRYLEQILTRGVTLRQASRLSSLTYTTLWRCLKNTQERLKQGK